MIGFVLFFVECLIVAFMCVKLGEDNVKCDLAEVLLNQLEEIDPLDPVAEIKMEIIKRIEAELL